MRKADNAPIGKLLVTRLLAFAEFERDLIIERTQTGKTIARAKGIQVDGRSKKFTTDQINHALGLLDAGNSYTQVEKLTGISKSTLIQAKRKEKQKPIHLVDHSIRFSARTDCFILSISTWFLYPPPAIISVGGDFTHFVLYPFYPKGDS